MSRWKMSSTAKADHVMTRCGQIVVSCESRFPLLTRLDWNSSGKGHRCLNCFWPSSAYRGKICTSSNSSTLQNWRFEFSACCCSCISTNLVSVPGRPSPRISTSGNKVNRINKHFFLCLRSYHELFEFLLKIPLVAWNTTGILEKEETQRFWISVQRNFASFWGYSFSCSSGEWPSSEQPQSEKKYHLSG